MRQKMIVTALPQRNATEIAGRAVRPAPAEALLVPGKVLGHGEDRVRQSFVQGELVGDGHVVRLLPAEALVVIDAVARVRRHGRCNALIACKLAPRPGET